MLKHYYELSKYKEGALQPMINIAYELSKNSRWSRVYPSTSHYALGLSPMLHFADRRECPMVYIDYSLDNKYYFVHFQKGQGNTVQTAGPIKRLHKKDFDDILEWLIT